MRCKLRCTAMTHRCPSQWSVVVPALIPIKSRLRCNFLEPISNTKFVGCQYSLIVENAQPTLLDVRFGSFADIAAAFPNVRFTPKNGHR